MYSVVLFYLFFITVLIQEVTTQLEYVTRRPLDQHTMLRKIKLYFAEPHLCALSFKDSRPHMDEDPNMKMIYFVTPTFPRPEQAAELTRLSHTLMLVPRIHWVVADDKYRCSSMVLDILRRSGLPYTFIVSPHPKALKSSVPIGQIPRGVANRRAAINWIRQTSKEGVMYFGDDDNTYDLELFSEIRKTKKLSMVPVGLVGYFGASAPVVKYGKVVGFFDSWSASRKFPVDMAGFAVNIKYLKYYATMQYRAGYLEDIFLTSSNFTIEDIEPLADNCTKVLVWHTRTVRNKPVWMRVNFRQLMRSQYFGLAKLLENLSRQKIIRVDRNGINAAVIFSLRKRNKFTYLTEL